MDAKPDKIILAYSGGLDTTVILTWLIEQYSAPVIAFCADLGQGDELEPVREKARACGASGVYVEDLREEFVRDFVFPMFRGGAVYEQVYLLGTSIARPLIAKRQIEIARTLVGLGSMHRGHGGRGPHGRDRRRNRRRGHRGARFRDWRRGGCHRRRHHRRNRRRTLRRCDLVWGHDSLSRRER